MKKFALLSLSLLSLTSIAQSQEDRDAILAQCGCREVEFDFVETFIYADDYERREPYHAHATAEWIFADETADDKIVIQHILVVNDSIIVKHWRQDWLFENTDVHNFMGDSKWDYVKLDENSAQGQWTQKVYQVDDSPRYQGSATWVHVDGRSFWESTTNAPLPRREYTKRSDYNVMERTNRHEITENGFDHVQENIKTVLTENEKTPIVSEAGLNRYTATDDSKCDAARIWWEEHKSYWRTVRSVWEEVLLPNNNIEIEPFVDGKLLWKALYAFEEEAKDLSETELREELKELMDEYVTLTPSVSSVE